VSQTGRLYRSGAKKCDRAPKNTQKGSVSKDKSKVRKTQNETPVYNKEPYVKPKSKASNNINSAIKAVVDSVKYE